ncbi:MAG: NDP-sugar synthase [Candidatus Methanofastidiosa archaeon]|nr:NDP-sugar synthase [Candidatus Methanofastidiosa archaeon]
MKALVLAGGFGTRLRPLTYTVPKCLLPVNNITILEHQVAMLSACDEIFLATNYLEDRIREFLSKTDLGHVVVNHEDTPLGTGGAVRNARELLGDSFVVLNGDIVSDCRPETLAACAHKSVSCVLATVPVPDVSRYGRIEEKDGRVTSFSEKEASNHTPGRINAGIYYCTKKVFSFIPGEGPSSLERDVFPRLAEKGLLAAHAHEGIWHDVGTRESYIEANCTLSKTAYVSAPDACVEESDISHSVILSGATVRHATITNSVIGFGARVEHDVVENAIVAKKG